jgi:hypothetical protein
MLKKTLFVLMIASCAAWAQRVDTPGSVRQILAGGDTSTRQSAPRPPAHVEVTPQPSSGAPDQPAASVEVMSSGPHAPAGKRDPFVSPIGTGSGGPQPAANCGAAKRCLVIDQLVLRGVVKTASGMIAVVANAVNKAYFLRENDPVFNGYVLHITGDSVVFKENTVDNIGHKGTREIVKKVTPPSA